ncbi:MAG: hypothetical protein HZC55_10005 [Verrucomicrobia bacterium]|jgi:hypothetical protein|nr:hypothetical protein [Verrucomicrobiota bacterium]
MPHKPKPSGDLAREGDLGLVLRLTGRALAAGVGGALVMLGIIRVLRLEMFEERPDLLLEQCAKTGMAVAALVLLASLARVKKVR